MVELGGLEPPTYSLQMSRLADELQPHKDSNFVRNLKMVGVPRIELGTSVLSGLRSSQVSYTPSNNKPF